MTMGHKFVLLLASVGAIFCSALLLLFMRTIIDNRLPWEGTTQFTREHYVAVGRSYGQGFTVGFFLCFSLILIAFVIGTWYERRRDLRRQARSTLEATVLPQEFG
jgi:glycerol uptake facilitator-like aquaporin